ncbi:MBL fold metallo-hydrolase [Microbulbifer agarilyticus]|uniref:MBL fold metallo-hydrolase n=1 Tax=Microbulbifer agarilyticus TaxID=260552 RepID=UPI001C949794|nr:MBL fold metallo-hydrolase [Microbulbifer agarilyticus]MBY6192038.1 MBL fold metallo-hydrolase [Microbulbifer agarilyticus]MCA0894648.1 MBL fold metallo-hydrolase [Microbulbifer agarilyticus]
MSVSLLNACAPAAHKFQNSEIDYRNEPANMWQILKAYWRAERAAPVPKAPIPVRTISAAELANLDGPDLVYRLGHSSVLLRLDGKYVLTDPVFSERASPVQWAGPKRFHGLPLELASLPEIAAVVISHDHYDHLDRATLLALDRKVARFITPLKIGDHLRRWGIAEDKIIELDWWQSYADAGLTFTATPAQHFSGRGLSDRDETLWAGWAIASADTRIFFSGDTGYFGGFREIGERLGPFDLTLIETGAYNTLWSQIHMLPEQSVQAHIDVRGKAMLPIHNSTFDLALHDWFEPLERVSKAARENGVQLVTPVIGAPLAVKGPALTHYWWRGEENAGDAIAPVAEVQAGN